jgi:hypothetical protein
MHGRQLKGRLMDPSQGPKNIYNCALFKSLGCLVLTPHTFEPRVLQSKATALIFSLEVTGRSLLLKSHHAFPKPYFFCLATHYPYL